MDPPKSSSFSSASLSRLSQSHPSVSYVSPSPSLPFQSHPSKPPSTPSCGLNANKLRPRARTIELESPKPENHPSKYMGGRVRGGKEYAIRRLNSETQMPSPTLKKLLCIYLLACEAVLDHVKEGELEPSTEVISEIRQYEVEMSEKNWYSAAGRGAASHKLEEDVIELRRLQYFARYGDYVKIMAHRVRKEVMSQQTEGEEKVSGQRSYAELAELAEMLHKEAEYYDKNASKSAPGQASTSQAVCAACMAVGIDFHQTRLAIYAYGERCDALHNNIFTLVEKDWSQAAKNTLSGYRGSV
ncbi:hypothetical protein MMC27_000093 [Xylographa pallens]|nr:hypothetical protein [Xylographa pallens]